MEEESATPSLSYATPAARPRRRWPSLAAPVAAVVIICGTLVIAAPAVVACVMRGQRSDDIPGPVLALLFLTGAAGLVIVVLGIFLAALHRPTGEGGA